MNDVMEEFKLSPAKLKKVITDTVAMAKEVKLQYVTDADEGYRRIKKGRGFQYVFRNKPLKDKEELKRIHSLVIPPAWKDVWICKLPNGHLQATGKDALQRKQYKYHSLWNKHRNHTKFHKMVLFGTMLPKIRKQVRRDLNLPRLVKEKVLALVLTLMDKTSIRVGNGSYEKLYGSFGLTTLKDKHAKIKKERIEFHFRGKKSVTHTVSLQNKKLAKLVKKCRDIPGKELFQYFDEEGKRHAVDSGMLNDYIHKIAGTDFTSKDFRTWAATTRMFYNLLLCKDCKDAQQRKKNLIESIGDVSRQLGNTPSVCKKYYIHPALINLYENNLLNQELQKMRNRKSGANPHLSSEEKLLLKLLIELHRK
ncbi:MAG: DNA topoisomerase I [Niastella sp. SCN 39-18]|nr:MAG: DNA topoisomerase I [Niastella sp. SCN 39-18]OJW08321.1 MAG: DNA topoisomerase I [Sphingobacteriales bacterium 39-19]